MSNYRIVSFLKTLCREADDRPNVGLTSGLPMVSPVLSRVIIHVSTWNKKAARHTDSCRAEYSILKLIAASADRDHGSRHVVSRVSLKKQILSILFLVKSKTCFAFANYLVSSKEK